jgi:hypothetical protein
MTAFFIVTLGLRPLVTGQLFGSTPAASFTPGQSEPGCCL